MRSDQETDLELPLSILFGYLLFREIPSAYDISGGVLIVVAMIPMMFTMIPMMFTEKFNYITEKRRDRKKFLTNK